VAPRQVVPGPLTLTAADRRSCPAAATACVDLTRHITWLQSAGQVIFGPVRAELGPPGSAHATPRGTFQVSWKAGPGFVSNIYHDPMPWAVFFAVGGIAFHGGSLTTPSHGCVHLTTENAHYYNEHLPVGAEVVVF
jgi:lipoprotein-anchoring transpeptidase ErfK/SrfK